MTSTAPLRPTSSADGDWRSAFVEHFGIVGDDMGLPRTMTRVLGWLVVCEPAQQSARQIQDGLGLSAGSVSTGLGGLVRGGLVERLTFPGDRHSYYRVRPGGWRQLLAARVRVLTEIRRIADQAVAAAGAHADHRLPEMRDFYAMCERRFTELLDQRT
jgi:DNA-binding transcriptional regulator GbsR (MarR family)